MDKPFQYPLESKNTAAVLAAFDNMLLAAGNYTRGSDSSLIRVDAAQQYAQRLDDIRPCALCVDTETGGTHIYVAAGTPWQEPGEKVDGRRVEERLVRYVRFDGAQYPTMQKRMTGLQELVDAHYDDIAATLAQTKSAESRFLEVGKEAKARLKEAGYYGVVGVAISAASAVIFSMHHATILDSLAFDITAAGAGFPFWKVGENMVAMWAEGRKDMDDISSFQCYSMGRMPAEVPIEELPIEEGISLEM